MGKNKNIYIYANNNIFFFEINKEYIISTYPIGWCDLYVGIEITTS